MFGMLVMLHWGVPVMRHANTPVMLCVKYPFSAAWGIAPVLHGVALSCCYSKFMLKKVHSCNAVVIELSSCFLPCDGQAHLATAPGTDVALCPALSA